MQTAGARKRIHVTETARLAKILERHGIPGEPKAVTLVRLVERADTLADLDADFLVFDSPGPAISSAQVASLLAEEDAAAIASARHD